MLCEMLAADSFSWNRLCIPFILFSLSNPSTAKHCLSIFFQGCLSWKGLIFFVFEIGFQSDFRLGARRKKSSLLVSGDHGASWGGWRVGRGGVGRHIDLSSGKTDSPLEKTVSLGLTLLAVRSAAGRQPLLDACIQWLMD